MRVFAVVYFAVLAVLTGLAVLGGAYFYRSYEPDDPAEAAAADYQYDFLSWEVEHFPRKWLYRVRHLFSERSAADEEDALRRYFQAEVRSDENEAEVEDIIEGRI